MTLLLAGGDRLMEVVLEPIKDDAGKVLGAVVRYSAT